jgi:hypothetical protein
VCLLLLAGLPRMASAYSLLTHEQVVDIGWRDQIAPLLVSRFPSASQQDLLQAHAYARLLDELTKKGLDTGSPTICGGTSWPFMQARTRVSAPGKSLRPGARRCANWMR